MAHLCNVAEVPHMSDQQELLRRALDVLPGGVLGSHRSGPGLEFVVREGRGAYLFDVNGRRYLDYLLGSGPMLLGHAHPAVVQAVQQQIGRGTSYMLLNEPAIQLAETIVRAVPCAEQVRYTSSGTEATFFALRVARAFRKREKVMKFEGGFHGAHDYALMSVVPRSPKAFPAPMADSAGIPHAITDEVMIAPYNDLATTEALIAAHHEQLAAVIIEPYQRTIVPAPGFLQGLRKITQRYEIPLVFDEIVTGFRFAFGGAQEYYGVVPDLAAFGKVVAGGFPLACVAGPKAIMRHFDAALEGTPEYVWQAGTFNGNAIACAAGLATLGELRKPGTYDRLFRTGARLRDGLAAAVRKNGLAAQVSGEAPVFDLFFTEAPIVDYRATLTADRQRIRWFNEELVRRGLVKAVNKIYVSLAHSDADVEETLSIFDHALAAVAARTA
jgi:glutamate-1-semialdehyde 2,1-aminomutase